MHIKTDHRERAARERGELGGIVMAMLSMGVDELVIDRKHSLWSYQHMVSTYRAEDGSCVYKIDRDRITRRALEK